MRKNSSTPTLPFKLPPWDRGHVIAAVIAVAMLAAVVIWTFPRRSLITDNTNQRSRSQDTSTTSDTFDQPAPAFSLPAVDGMTITSRELFHTPLVVLTFWSVECGDCQSQLSIIKQWLAESDGQIIAVAIHRGNDLDQVRTAMVTAPTNFSVLLDQDHRISTAYGVKVLPTTVFIRQGIVVGMGQGVLTADQLQRSTESLLNESLQ